MGQKLKMAWQWRQVTFVMGLRFSARDRQSLQLSWNPRMFDNNTTIRKFPCSVYPTCSPCPFLRTCRVEQRVRTLCSMPDNNVEENSLADAGSGVEHTKILRREELMALLADPPGAKLARELTEANQQNRYLKQQLHKWDDALANFKNQFAAIIVEIQHLITLRDEAEDTEIPEECFIFNRITDLREKLKGYTDELDFLQFRDVPITWYGMAKSVRVMGSFDGWTQGEHMSPEGTGSNMKFTATLRLRPGGYDIKFLVDGQWQLSTDLAHTGRGNNLLSVD